MQKFGLFVCLFVCLFDHTFCRKVLTELALSIGISLIGIGAIEFCKTDELG